MKHNAAKLLKIVRRKAFHFLAPLYFHVKNRFSHAPVIGTSPVVVSMTTHGKRTQNVFCSIESIAAGNTKPQRLILWIDDASVFNNLPKTLMRLQRRGLEIVLTENYGPHTKYYPYVASVDEHLLPLATADDDIIYPRSWLFQLLAVHSDSTNGEVVCHRAHRLRLADGRMASYSEWSECTTATPSILNFATGVSGVIYPKDMLNELNKLGPSFLNSTPKNDDIWLHHVAMRGGRKVRQITNVARHFPLLPFDQDIGLLNSNVYGSGNDAQLNNLYTNEDFDVLSKAE